MKRLDILPNDTELKILEQLVQVLNPFKEVTVQISAEAYVIISTVRPLLFHLSENVLDIKSSVIQKMKTEMNKTVKEDTVMMLL